MMDWEYTNKQAKVIRWAVLQKYAFLAVFFFRCGFANRFIHSECGWICGGCHCCALICGWHHILAIVASLTGWPRSGIPGNSKTKGCLQPTYIDIGQRSCKRSVQRAGSWFVTWNSSGHFRKSGYVVSKQNMIETKWFLTGTLIIHQASRENVDESPFEPIIMLIIPAVVVVFLLILLTVIVIVFRRRRDQPAATPVKRSIFLLFKLVSQSICMHWYLHFWPTCPWALKPANQQQGTRTSFVRKSSLQILNLLWLLFRRF